MLTFLIFPLYCLLYWRLRNKLNNKVAAFNLDVHKQMKPVFAYLGIWMATLIGCLFLGLSITETQEPVQVRLAIALFSIIYLSIITSLNCSSVYLSKTNMIVVSKFLKVEQGALTDLIRIESKHFAGNAGSGSSRHRFHFSNGKVLTINSNQIMDDTLLAYWINSAQFEG